MKPWIALSLIALMIGGCAPQSTLTPAPSSKPCVTASQLNQYGYQQLEKVAKLLREDKKNIASFEGFIETMKGTVDNYAEMIKSSVHISNVVRFLPIPYAGEVSTTAKLISKTVLNLGGAASALNRYKADSDLFLSSFDKINPNDMKAAEIAKLAQFADTKLLKDAKELENALTDISESTAAMAATTQSIDDALDTTGNYVNQAKSFVGFTQPKTTDKSTVAQTKSSINAKMAQLNQKIASLEKSGDAQRLYIAKARIYSELAVQMEK